jgi:hypothetical protein
MAVIEIAKIQVRRGRENVTGVPTLAPGEFGWAQDTQNLYIGRSVEEGANSTGNTRLLTDRDLNNIFELINYGADSQAHDSQASYRYRPNLPFGVTAGSFASTTTTIGKKLDNWISLTDFVGPEDFFASGEDITLLLEKALKSIYQNDPGLNAVRSLIIPAGKFTIAGPVDLPPNVNLVGDGVDITTLVSISNDQPMFRTVDALGNNYNIGMQTADNISANVQLSEMTLAYTSSTINNSPLLSLDNSKEALIHNVKFTTIGIDLSTSSSITTGTGLLIRGGGIGGGVDPSTAVSIGTRIENCIFENIGWGVKSEDYVLQPIISHCTFENLYEGIRLTSSALGKPVPQAMIVSNNLFRFIYSSAINVTTSTGFVSNLISQNNAYYFVGNFGSTPDDIINSPVAPVLNFDSPGNISVNDYFHRSTLYSENPAILEYYNPLANGYVKIINNSTRIFTIQGDGTPSNSNLQVFRIPLTDGDQSGVLEYQLYNKYVSRSGRLTVSIAEDGYASISDQYNYSETTTDEAAKLIFSTSLDFSRAPYYNVSYGSDKNFVAVTLSNYSTSTAYLTYNVDLTLNPIRT